MLESSHIPRALKSLDSQPRIVSASLHSQPSAQYTASSCLSPVALYLQSNFLAPKNYVSCKYKESWVSAAYYAENPGAGVVKSFMSLDVLGESVKFGREEGFEE